MLPFILFFTVLEWILNTQGWVRLLSKLLQVLYNPLRAFRSDESYFSALGMGLSVV